MDRIHFLQSLMEKSYTMEDLHNLCEIMSFEPGSLAPESLLRAMINELKARIVSEGCDLEKVSKRVSAIDPLPKPSPVQPDFNLELLDPFTKVFLPESIF